MAEYIEREALLALETFMQDADGFDHSCVLSADICRCPAADVAPVVHGRWINEVELHPELYGWVALNNVVCSVCKKANSIEKPYCPNCGAKMDGGKP